MADALKVMLAASAEAPGGFLVRIVRAGAEPFVRAFTERGRWNQANARRYAGAVIANETMVGKTVKFVDQTKSAA